MALADWFGVKDSTRCIVCGGCYYREDAHIESSGLCICEACGRKIKKYTTPSAFSGNKYLNSYITGHPYSGVLKDAFICYKFEGQQSYSKVFSEILYDVAKYFVKEDDFDLVIPVPISRKRMTERGFNQSELIAEDLAQRLLIEYSKRALFRVRHTKRQSGLGARQRAKNVEGAFLADKWIVQGKKILLVDDIYTRGATISECAKELKKAGALKVVGITLFRSEDKDEKPEYEFKEN